MAMDGMSPAPLWRPPGAAVAIDPVCGMEVEPDRAAGSHSHRGRQYYFCSGHCLEAFRAQPEKYLAPRPLPVESPKGTIYTCPMHPEVRKAGPGSCPICGMALEPLEPAGVEEEESGELADLRRRFWISLALTVPVMSIDMLDMIPGRPLGTALGERAP